jgi:phosphatidylglycerophosphate synthase
MTKTRTNEPAERQPHAAIILANHNGFGDFGLGLASVGALPVLLRAILGAKKAGAARIVVVEDAATGESVQTRLAETRRLPKCVEWVHIGRGKESVASVIGRLATEANDHLVLISGDRTYHSSLHRQAAEWNGNSCALAFTTAGRLAGIYALAPLTAIWLSQHCSPNARSVEDLHAALNSAYSTDCEEVPEEKWQIIRTPEDRILAEHKLDRWLVKPTDGIFAQANRRVSIPISRQLIKFPITPNMVSLFTLGVSFAAGWYYGVGGYWNVLLGALLSLFASILDGSDGEVARLKLLESDFGCWLETVCDYLYYVFIFAGITVGLVRSSGNRGYFIWGGMLLVGAVLSFLVTGFQRQHLTAGRPEQLLTIWQTKATSRKSPGVLNLAGRIEFVIRRCFMPYALLLFAIFNITQVAFIIASVGANIIWLADCAVFAFQLYERANVSISQFS